MNQKFQLSINKNIVNKSNPHAEGWENVTLDISQLSQHICNGFAFSPGVIKELVSGRKPKKYEIEYAQLLAIDIDNETRERDIENKSWVKVRKTEENGYISWETVKNDVWI